MKDERGYAAAKPSDEVKGMRSEDGTNRQWSQNSFFPQICHCLLVVESACTQLSRGKNRPTEVSDHQGKHITARGKEDYRNFL